VVARQRIDAISQGIHSGNAPGFGAGAPDVRCLAADGGVMEAKQLLDAARALQPELMDLRRRIHNEPELGLDNPATREKVLAALEPLGLELEQHARTSGVVATLRGARPGRTILLRADTDALPMPEDTDLPFRSKRDGVMHACGHDAHTSMLVGAARLLAESREALAGNVVFMFQPGEEGYAGAKYMLNEGLLERDPPVDAAFAIHVAPQLPPGMIGTRSGPIMASADFFEVTVRGKGGHGSMPHDCVDPIPPACEMVQALQSFVTRRIPATDPVVLTITQINGGTTNNVIPESVQLVGTLRALSERSRKLAHDGIPQVLNGVAQAHGVTAELVLPDDGYPVTSNSPEFEGFARDVARQVLGENSVFEFPSPVMGAEDFSFVLNQVPGAMIFLGVRPPGNGPPAPCHSNRMLLEEDALPGGAALYAAIATHFLSTP